MYRVMALDLRYKLVFTLYSVPIFFKLFLFDDGQQIIIEFVYTDMLRNVNKIFFAIIF